jgi:two-component system, response regulator
MSAHGRGGPILLVEDNPDDVALTLRALKDSRIANEVRVARDGEEALRMLHGGSAFLPSLVLLDLKLPKVDGLEVLDAVRRHEATKLLPIVVLTSSIEDEDVLASYRRGVNSYMRKPVEFERFVDAVRQLGMYWLVLNVPPPEAT